MQIKLNKKTFDAKANKEMSIYIIFTDDNHIKTQNSTLISNVVLQKVLIMNLRKYKNKYINN